MLKNKTAAEARERLRRLTYPFRLTEHRFSASEDPLQYGRLRTRYNLIEEWYAEKVYQVKRNWDIPLWEQQYHDWVWHSAKMDVGIRKGWDINIMYRKLLNNIYYAQRNGEKALLMEDIQLFPIMNYDLGEGPYSPHPHSRFGVRDGHVILQGDLELIYFEIQVDGLDSGRYVDNLAAHGR